MRVLKLTSPFMRGDDVKRVQGYLRQFSPDLLADGEYGPATGAEVAAWKYRMGYPRDAINTGMGVEAQQIMFRGTKPLRPDYVVTRLKRMALGWKPGWGIAKKPAYQPSEAASLMESWAGYTENPAGSNKVPQLMELGRKLGVGWEAGMGYPWCGYASFLSALARGGKAAKAGLIDHKFNALYTVDILANAQKAQNGLKVVGASQAKRGDLVMFNFPGGDPRVDHIGRLRAAPSGDFASTVEGNTSAGSAGSQSNGGGVYLRDRPMSDITAFIRDV
jgi:hypothetical protein